MSVIFSFALPNGTNIKRNLEAACARLKEEKLAKPGGKNQKQPFDYEIIEGMETIRVNVYNGTHADAFWLGNHFCSAKLSGHAGS
jgi:hypothetical protein